MTDLTLHFLAAACQVVALDLSIRTYPAGDPVRDAAHVKVLERLRRVLHPSSTWRTEVPLSIPGDQRAWDAEIRGFDWRVQVEAETRLVDSQAFERRLALKIRDGGVTRLIVVLPDTFANRAALTAIRPHLRELLPLDTRPILAALRAGRDPGGSGIVVL